MDGFRSILNRKVLESTEDLFDRLFEELNLRALTEVRGKIRANLKEGGTSPGHINASPLAVFVLKEFLDSGAIEEHGLTGKAISQLAYLLEEPIASLPVQPPSDGEPITRLPYEEPTSYSASLLADPDFASLSGPHRAQLLKLTHSVLEIFFPGVVRVVPAIVESLRPRVTKMVNSQVEESIRSVRERPWRPHPERPSNPSNNKPRRRRRS